MGVPGSTAKPRPGPRAGLPPDGALGLEVSGRAVSPLGVAGSRPRRARVPRRGSWPPHPSSDAGETPPPVQERRADVAWFPRRAGVGVPLKDPRENKNGAERMYVSPGEGGEDGDGGGRGAAGSVLIEPGQRENPQVCRKITSFPVPIALPCDSCFLGDSKMPGFS